MNQILFADRVLIAEGATEQSVLPELFKSLGRQFSTHKTALVIADGCAGIHKMGRILDRIGVPYKALVDLDYAFTTARAANLLADDDETLTEAISLLSASAFQNNFELEGGVLPKKTGGIKACVAYELFADEEASQDVIATLHNKLKAHGYWLWTKGAIEKHLSLEAKTTNDWISFKLLLRTDGAEQVLDDYETVNDMAIWATS
nr:ATP-dependent endonuclease [Grimontia sedimenti]